MESEVLPELSRLALTLGDGEVARQHALDSLDIANELGLGLRKTYSLIVLGLARINVGQRDLGIAYLQQAMRSADQQEYWLRMGAAEEDLCRLSAMKDITR